MYTSAQEALAIMLSSEKHHVLKKKILTDLDLFWTRFLSKTPPKLLSYLKNAWNLLL